MLQRFRYALLACALVTVTPVAFADTPADTLVIAKISTI